MYNEGDLLVTTEPCKVYKKEDYCDCEERHGLYDARGGGKREHPLVYLPHSCDEWLIGGEKEIMALISDLQKMLAATKW